jgi:hypothetical protein
MSNKYVVLQETSEEEFESWMYFIKLEGNENNLSYLKHQLDQVDWKIYEGFSTFDLDMEHLVSEQTAKEMTKVELNVYFHRKFDGELKRIDFGFKNKDNNKKKIKRVFYKLGHGMIDKYIDEEDVSDDDDDLLSENDDESVSDAETVSSTEESEEEEEEEEAVSSHEEDEGIVTPPPSMPKMLQQNANSKSKKK